VELYGKQDRKPLPFHIRRFPRPPHVVPAQAGTPFFLRSQFNPNTLQHSQNLSQIEYKRRTKLLNELQINDEMQYSLDIIEQQPMHYTVAPLIEQKGNEMKKLLVTTAVLSLLSAQVFAQEAATAGAGNAGNAAATQAAGSAAGSGTAGTAGAAAGTAGAGAASGGFLASAVAATGLSVGTLAAIGAGVAAAAVAASDNGSTTNHATTTHH
jgi:hypothetical protein